MRKARTPTAELMMEERRFWKLEVISALCSQTSSNFFSNTPHPHPHFPHYYSLSGCPDRQTLLVMAPWHERTESSLSVNASSAPHALFLDQTDIRDHPPLHCPNPSAPPDLNTPTSSSYRTLRATHTHTHTLSENLHRHKNRHDLNVKILPVISSVTYLFSRLCVWR